MRALAHRVAWSFLAWLAATAAAALAASEVGPADLAGRFDNAAQVAALPAEVAREPKPGKPWVDRQFARFVPFPAAELGEYVYYLEWRAGGPEGRISRQRVWAFLPAREGVTPMRFYTLERGEDWAAAEGDPVALAALSAAALLPYPDGCEVLFAVTGEGRFEGEIPGGACGIVARQSGRRMEILARISLGRESLQYDEAGLLEDGRAAFRVPEGYRYEFRRVE
jgi:hypothetical protein